MPIIDFSIIFNFHSLKFWRMKKKASTCYFFHWDLYKVTWQRKWTQHVHLQSFDISTKISTPSNLKNQPVWLKKKSILFALSKLIKGHKNHDIISQKCSFLLALLFFNIISTTFNSFVHAVFPITLLTSETLDGTR